FFQPEREQQPFDGDEAVAGLLARLLGRVEDPRQRRVEIDLPRTATTDLRALGERGLDSLQGLARITARAVDQARRQPFRVVEQDFQEMIGAELLMTLAKGQGLRGLHETAGAVRIFLEIHVVRLPRPIMAPVFKSEPPEAARPDIM